MARQARRVSSTSYYHLMVRGINKESVFSTNQHKRVLLKYLIQELKVADISVMSWCIMANHAHFVAKGELHEISEFIKKLLIRYSYYYNKFNDRVGPVFGDRFRSEVIQDDNSLKQVVRYVHRNPIKAGLVHNINEYIFSSYNEYLYDTKVICDEQKIFYFNYFKNSKNRFVSFHKEDQIADYFIDTKEDTRINQSIVFNNIISKHMRKHKIIELKEYETKKNLFKSLIKELYDNTNYTIRGIASELGYPRHKIEYLLKKSRDL